MGSSPAAGAERLERARTDAGYLMSAGTDITESLVTSGAAVGVQVRTSVRDHRRKRRSAAAGAGARRRLLGLLIGVAPVKALVGALVDAARPRTRMALAEGDEREVGAAIVATP